MVLKRGRVRSRGPSRDGVDTHDSTGTECMIGSNCSKLMIVYDFLSQSNPGLIVFYNHTTSNSSEVFRGC